MKRSHTTALALAIGLVQLIALSYLARQHPFGTYTTETDFYHLFAPDAERLATGQFPANTFQGPGYPAVIAALGKLTGLSHDLFTVGKWLSVLCAVGCGWLTYRLFAQLFNQWVGLGTQLLLIVSGDFPQYSISATTDVFFLLLCLATLVVLLNQHYSRNWRTATAALLTGTAYLVRYNGVFLIVACLAGIVLFNLLGQSWRARWQAALLFLGLCTLVCLPWFVVNARVKGSPLYNTNYLNMATEFFPELVKGEVNQDATRALATRFHSFGDVLRHDPARLLNHYPRNLWESLKLLSHEQLADRWLPWLALGGLLLLLWQARHRKAAWWLMGAGFLYLLLMGLNHWEARYYFFMLLLCAGLATYCVVEAFAQIKQLILRLGSRQGAQRNWVQHSGWVALPFLLWCGLFATNLRASAALTREFLASHPAEISASLAYLQGQGVCQNAAPKTIVARKPHLPYLCRAQWVFFPQVQSIDELQQWLAANQVDYLLISQREMKERKKLRPLGDPAKAPAWLKPVWSNKEPVAVLYQPVKQ